MVEKTLWLSNLPEFARELQTTERFIHRYVTELAADSIINGSALTGSPGQPHDLADADPSSGKDWEIVYEGETSSTIGNADKSARSVEEGFSHKHGRPLTKLKSPQGGFHSVAITHQNSDKIVASVIQRVRGNVR